MKHLLCCLLLVACAAPPAPVRLARIGAVEQDFATDRYACVQEAERRTSTAAVAPSGIGAAQSTSRPSRSIYLNCMAARGYRVVETGGFLPQTPIDMGP